MHNPIGLFLLDLLNQLVTLNFNTILLIILLVMMVIVIDSLNTYARKKKIATGLGAKASVISIDGAKSVPVRTYVSETQGLAGRPDALMIENGFVVPVERKPLARKMRDRYIAQLLVYMRLVEEFEGKKPPYGYLILGPSCRKVKIMNSPDRQAWLSKMISEMNAVLEGRASVLADPIYKKCEKCDVRTYCTKRIEPKPQRRVQGNSSARLAQRVG